MWKFAVLKIRGNDETVIGWCGSKEEAMQSGAECFAALPKGEGIIAAAEAEWDAARRRISGYQKVWHVWY